MARSFPVSLQRLQQRLDERLLPPRLLIVVGVVLAAALLAPLLPLRYALALLGLFGVLLFIQKPQVGIAVLIAASLVIPFEIATGTLTTINITVLLLTLLLGLFVLEVIGPRQLRLVPSRTIRPIVAFVAVASLAFSVGYRPWFLFAQNAPLAAQFGGLAIFFLSPGAFLLVAHQVRTVRWLQGLTWLFLVLGALYIAGRLIPGFRDLGFLQYPRGATDSLFWTWLVALAAGQALVNRRLHPVWRIALGLLVMVTLYVALFHARAWVSGWIPALAALLGLVWAAAPYRAVTITLIAGVLTASRLPRLIEWVLIGDNQYSLVTRLAAWETLVEILKISPVLGLGPANYHWYTRLFPVLGYYVNFNSHNNFIDTIAQTGLLGLICLLWIVFEIGRLGWQLRSQVPAGFAYAYVCGALGGLVGTLVASMFGDWFLPFVYNVGVKGFRSSVLAWLFLGGLVVLEQKYARSPDTNQAESQPSAQ